MIGRRLTDEELTTFTDVIEPALAAKVRVVHLPSPLRRPSGLTVHRVVMIRRSRAGDENLLAHELVHVGQYAEHGLFGFLWNYGRQYFSQRRIHRGHWNAYKHMPFEVEAEKLAKKWHPKPPRA